MDNDTCHAKSSPPFITVLRRHYAKSQRSHPSGYLPVPVLVNPTASAAREMAPETRVGDQSCVMSTRVCHARRTMPPSVNYSYYLSLIVPRPSPVAPNGVVDRSRIQLYSSYVHYSCFFRRRFYPRDAIASACISCRRVSVCPSVTSRCSTETAKHRITQTTPYDSPGR